MKILYNKALNGLIFGDKLLVALFAQKLYWKEDGEGGELTFDIKYKKVTGK